VQAGYDFRTEGTDFIIIGTGFGSMNNEVYPETVAVYMPQHVHQPGFDPTSVHATDDVENTYRFDILACGVHKTALFR
jgi:hypothetical protein